MTRRPLVIFGLDAGDSTFIRRGIAEGWLPNLARIATAGFQANTCGNQLMNEHGTWLSFNTGLTTAEHGYYFLRQLVPGTYRLANWLGWRDVEAQPFWEPLRERGDNCLIVDCTDARIVRGLRGKQLMHWQAHYPLTGIVSEPPTLAEDVQRRFAPAETIQEVPGSTPGHDRNVLEMFRRRIAAKRAFLEESLKRESHDFVYVQFGEMHTAGHQFWKYRNGSDAALSKAIEEVYSLTDEVIGLVMKHVGEDANYLALSSVGLRGQYPTDGFTEPFLDKMGWWVPQRKPSGLRPLDIARRLMPASLRQSISRHFSRDRREALLADGFERGTDWSKSKAYALPSFYVSFVRVNLAGRDPQGIVPQSEYEATVREIESGFMELRRPDGSPVIESIDTTYTVGDGKPPMTMPDLFVAWLPHDSFIETVEHPTAGRLTQKPPEFNRDSFHTPEGWCAACGPGMKAQGDLGDVDFLQITPTAMELLGLPPRSTAPPSLLVEPAGVS